jgi:hypothetical protein
LTSLPYRELLNALERSLRRGEVSFVRMSDREVLLRTVRLFRRRSLNVAVEIHEHLGFQVEVTMESAHNPNISCSIPLDRFPLDAVPTAIVIPAERMRMIGNEPFLREAIEKMYGRIAGRIAGVLAPVEIEDMHTVTGYDA